MHLDNWSVELVGCFILRLIGLSCWYYANWTVSHKNLLQVTNVYVANFKRTYELIIGQLLYDWGKISGPMAINLASITSMHPLTELLHAVIF